MLASEPTTNKSETKPWADVVTCCLRVRTEIKKVHSETSHQLLTRLNIRSHPEQSKNSSATVVQLWSRVISSPSFHPARGSLRERRANLMQPQIRAFMFFTQLNRQKWQRRRRRQQPTKYEMIQFYFSKAFSSPTPSTPEQPFPRKSLGDNQQQSPTDRFSECH